MKWGKWERKHSQHDWFKFDYLKEKELKKDHDAKIDKKRKMRKLSKKKNRKK